MKVFISWSGEGSPSHQVALILRDWLPSVIQAVKPFVSCEDIDKGTRGLVTIDSELQETACGVICLSRANFERPWINYEAGVLSKQIADAKSRVMPLLIDLDNSDLTGPLTQPQTTRLKDKADVYKMVASVNRALGDDALADNVLGSTFNGSSRWRVIGAS